MTTALALIESAFRKSGILSAGDSLSSEEANDALDVFNDMLGSWSNMGLTVFTQSTDSYPLSAGVASYTIGTGGDFNTSRPVSILSAYVRLGTTDHPIAFVSAEEFGRIQTKSTQGAPIYVYFDNNYPLATFTFYPIPTGGYTFFLVSEKPLTEAATLNTTISFPPGWKRAFTYNLALDLAPEYGQPVDQAVVRIAKESLAAIRIQVAKAKMIQAYPSNGRNDNIYTGWNR